MKVIHLTDLHISSQAVMHSDPVAPCLTAFRHIKQHHDDAERIIVTGDLTDKGDLESYVGLQAILRETGFLNDRRLKLMLGNHDNREAFRKVFPDTPATPEGYIQGTDDTPIGRFIYLDTLEQGKGEGQLCESRLSWLRDNLQTAREQGIDTWLFMHHNPIQIHVMSSDSIGLAQMPSFQELMKEYQDVVRHIAFGHCHFTLSGSLHGIPLSANRGTARGLWPSIGQTQIRFATGTVERHYNVIFAESQSTLVHSIDFMNQDNVEYLS